MSTATLICSKCGNRIEITELLDVDARLIADSQATEIKRLRSEALSLSALRDKFDAMENELADWKHRAVGGTCRILSDPECDCSLCRRDKEIERLRIANHELRGMVDTICDQYESSPTTQFAWRPIGVGKDWYERAKTLIGEEEKQ